MTVTSAGSLRPDRHSRYDCGPVGADALLWECAATRLGRSEAPRASSQVAARPPKEDSNLITVHCRATREFTSGELSAIHLKEVECGRSGRSLFAVAAKSTGWASVRCLRRSTWTIRIQSVKSNSRRWLQLLLATPLPTRSPILVSTNRLGRVGARSAHGRQCRVGLLRMGDSRSVVFRYVSPR